MNGIGIGNALRFAAILATTTTFPFLASAASDDMSCAKVKVEGGPTCATLKATFDVASCKLEKPSYAAWVQCKGGSAIARAKVGQSRLRVDLKKSEGGSGAWGGVSGEWSTVGAVRMESLPSAASSAKPAQESAHHPSTVDTKTPAPSAAVSSNATANREPAGVPPTNPSPSSSGNGSLQFSGYFDVYYAQNFNNPITANGGTSTTLPGPQNGMQYFNWYANQFALNMVEFSVKQTRKETSFVLDLIYGQQAEANAQAANTTLIERGGPTPGASEQITKHVGQAVFSYAPEAVKGLTFDAGKMYTHVGLETPKAKDNWNYSRATLFGFGIPFWHTGVRVGYAIVPDRLAASVYVYNGWNTTNDLNSSPTLGGQMKWTPTDKLTAVYNYIGGPERERNDNDWKQVHNFNATYVLSPSLSLAFDGILAWEDNLMLNNPAVGGNTPQRAQWSSAEILAKWQITSSYSLAPRLEYFDDPQGYTLGGSGQSLQSYTLTQAFAMSEGLEGRLEVRHDRSTSPVRFMGGGGAAQTQTLALVSLLYTL